MRAAKRDPVPQRVLEKPEGGQLYNVSQTVQASTLDLTLILKVYSEAIRACLWLEIN